MARSKTPLKVAILAGGTGGHIFPALAVAEALQQKGHIVMWIGAIQGMETRIVPQQRIPLELIPIQNLRGKGAARYALLPWRLLRAVWRARAIFKKHEITLALGFGGFVAGPGGLAAKSLGIPLVIHEQNAVAGLTNRYLAKIARRVLVGFPSAFPGLETKILTGNPIRKDLLPLRDQAYLPHTPLRVLVVGGSLGAKIFNEVIPAAFAKLHPAQRPLLWQQTGLPLFEATDAAFKAYALEGKVSAFIEDMFEAYAWADLIVCRAGALTVAELSLIGKPAIFVPLPHAVDDHQTKNAEDATLCGGAMWVPQSEFTVENVADLLNDILKDPSKLTDMAAKMKALGRPDATLKVVQACEQFGV